MLPSNFSDYLIVIENIHCTFDSHIIEAMTWWFVQKKDSIIQLSSGIIQTAAHGSSM